MIPLGCYLINCIGNRYFSFNHLGGGAPISFIFSNCMGPNTIYAVALPTKMVAVKLNHYFPIGPLETRNRVNRKIPRWFAYRAFFLDPLKYHQRFSHRANTPPNWQITIWFSFNLQGVMKTLVYQPC